MPIPHQRPIVVALWCLAIADAIRQGIALPASEFVTLTSPTHQFNPAITVFGLLAPPACVFGTVFLRSSFKTATFGAGRLSRWVDTRWGEGSANSFLRSLRPTALVGVGAFVLGTVGTLSSLKTNATSFSFEVASFFLAGGIGFGIARFIALRLLPNEPWV
ncbi:hypothetical protein [Aquabacterium humicola]|uniref:hypothetical protein n=1 Tax=Aquabacterium humicola TaxID=3237377 RepID=UPI0025430EA2|nr:hypothetical protein [Rubrivivax pictus]